MDDMTRLEQRMADDALRLVGPSRPVDVDAIFSAITATQSPKWRFQTMFSATRFVVAGAIVALFGGFLLMSAPHRGSDVRHDSDAAAPASTATALPRPTDGSSEERHTLVIDEITLSIEAPWHVSDDLQDGLYISRDTSGSQAAEAMILWTTFPGSRLARPCLLDPSVSSAGELAASVASAPGTELVSGPADVTVGGQAAKHVVVTVAPDAFLERVTGGARTRTLGCGPAYFFGWEPYDGGAFWQETVPGDNIGIWIVDVDGTLLFIEAATHAEVGPTVERDVQTIIDSVRFE